MEIFRRKIHSCRLLNFCSIAVFSFHFSLHFVLVQPSSDIFFLFIYTMIRFLHRSISIFHSDTEIFVVQIAKDVEVHSKRVIVDVVQFVFIFSFGLILSVCVSIAARAHRTLRNTHTHNKHSIAASHQ